MAVIAIAAFFVVSSLSLSNRLDEGKFSFPFFSPLFQYICRIKNTDPRLRTTELEIQVDIT